MAYIIDAAGFVTGTYCGPGSVANGTDLPPPANAKQPLQFLDGAWLTIAPENHFITYLSLLSRFTGNERSIIRDMQPRDHNVADFIMLAQAAEHIDLDDARVTFGVKYFASVGIITDDRAAEILSLEISESERP